MVALSSSPVKYYPSAAAAGAPASLGGAAHGTTPPQRSAAVQEALPPSQLWRPPRYGDDATTPQEQRPPTETQAYTWVLPAVGAAAAHAASGLISRRAHAALQPANACMAWRTMVAAKPPVEAPQAQSASGPVSAYPRSLDAALLAAGKRLAALQVELEAARAREAGACAAAKAQQRRHEKEMEGLKVRGLISKRRAVL
jgi:hypothetical protein